MSWVKENKFAASIIGITTVISGSLLYVGSNARSAADVAKTEYTASIKRIDSLQAAKPYPDDNNKLSLAQNLKNLSKNTKRFQNTLLLFRPGKLPKTSGNAFKENVSIYFKELTKLYNDRNIGLPNDGKCSFGFEKYSRDTVEDRSTRYLTYHKNALDWLFKKLANSGIDEIKNIYRPLAAEKLSVFKPKRSKRDRKKRRRKEKVNNIEVKSVHDVLPLELTFRGSEASVERFITDVVSNDRYYFIIKSVRLKNDKQDPVLIPETVFPEKEPDSEGIEGFKGFGDNTEPEKVSEEIVKNVIGNEKITAFLQLELVLFKQAKDVMIPNKNVVAPKGNDKKLKMKGKKILKK